MLRVLRTVCYTFAMYYIIGLGNPGEKYIGTRHNVGRDLLHSIAADEHMGAWECDKLAQAQQTHGMIGGEEVALVLPETFMNRSGETVRFLCEKRGAPAAALILIYDDVDLPVGEVKISVGRGSGGHNGVESVIAAIGTKEFVRVRIGVAGKSFWTGKTVRPTGREMNKHVLGKFSGREQKQIAEAFEVAKKALVSIMRDGVEKAMNQYN